MTLTSLIVPIFNSSRYLSRCIRSIQSQTSLDHDVIYVDDGSTDNSLSILKSMTDNSPITKILQSKVNHGLPHSLNRAIKASSSEFILRLDSDDYVNHLYVEALSMALRANPQYIGVTCDYFTVSEDESVLSQHSWESSPIGCSFLYRRDVAVSIGMYDEQFTCHEDSDFLHRFRQAGQILHLPLPLYRYRTTPNSLSSCEARMSYHYDKFVLKHNV